MKPFIEIHQLRDAAGNEDYMRFQEPIVPKNKVQPLPEAIRDFLIHLHPTRSGTSGTYHYADPRRGSGTLTVRNVDRSDIERVDEMVHLLEIESKIGRTDPSRQPDAPAFVIPFAITNRSPYVKVCVDLMYLYAGLLLTSVGINPEFDTGSRILAAVLGVAMICTCIWMLYRDARRFRWWHAARAQARRDGGPLPEELRVWS